ncbi:hypothetical protein MRX96_048376 [Rhipicephalus microplus]
MAYPAVSAYVTGLASTEPTLRLWRRESAVFTALSFSLSLIPHDCTRVGLPSRTDAPVPAKSVQVSSPEMSP